MRISVGRSKWVHIIVFDNCAALACLLFFLLRMYESKMLLLNNGKLLVALLQFESLKLKSSTSAVLVC